MNIDILLFSGFEPLDVFGPVEAFVHTDGVKVQYFSQNGGQITTFNNLKVDTKPFNHINPNDTILLPGGAGTRPLVKNTKFVSELGKLAAAAKYVLTVCTGSAVLARTPLLNGKKATSNKNAFDWVKSQNDQVDWQGNARWVRDGKYYTASGISAGTDMALGFISDQFGKDKAQALAKQMEYTWNADPKNDPFAVTKQIE